MLLKSLCKKRGREGLKEGTPGLVTCGHGCLSQGPAAVIVQCPGPHLGSPGHRAFVVAQTSVSTFLFGATAVSLRTFLT